MESREEENEEGGKQGEVSLFQKPDAGYDSRCEYKKHFILRGLLFINPLSPRDLIKKFIKTCLALGDTGKEGLMGTGPFIKRAGVQIFRKCRTTSRQQLLLRPCYTSAARTVRLTARLL